MRACTPFFSHIRQVPAASPVDTATATAWAANATAHWQAATARTAAGRTETAQVAARVAVRAATASTVHHLRQTTVEHLATQLS